MTKLKTILLGLAGLAVAASLAGCMSDAQVASSNLRTAADNFEINRRIVFYNGITGDYILTIEGLCSQDASEGRKLAVTCKTGPSAFKKHFLGLSDNVTYFSEQLEAAQVHYVPGLYAEPSFGDERLMSVDAWWKICQPDQIITFNGGLDYALVFERK